LVRELAAAPAADIFIPARAAWVIRLARTALIRNIPKRLAKLNIKARSFSRLITPDGRAIEIEVVKGPGLGLEEKAVEAVKQWRFKPAMGPSGKPVAVVVPIEVTFRLL
jgi:TonB family protein